MKKKFKVISVVVSVCILIAVVIGIVGSGSDRQENVKKQVASEESSKVGKDELDVEIATNANASEDADCGNSSKEAESVADKEENNYIEEKEERSDGTNFEENETIMDVRQGDSTIPPSESENITPTPVTTSITPSVTPTANQSSGKTVTVTPTKAPTATPTPSSDAEAKKVAQSVINGIINSSMTDFEKVLAIHDWLTFNVDYDYTNYKNGTIPTTSYSALGVFQTKKAVCQGYALAFKLLAETAGLEVTYVTGTANNGTGNGYEGHAWNQVKVNGVWYNIDVTWDDPIGSGDHSGNGYSYFLISDAQINKNHKASVTTKTCSSNYDRATVFKAAVESGLHGSNVAFVQTESEAITAINSFGKSNVSEQVIWYYDTSINESNVGDFVWNILWNCDYPNTGEIAYSCSNGLCKIWLELSMTEKDISGIPIVYSSEKLNELLNTKFDSGATSCTVILDVSKGEEAWDFGALRYDINSELNYFWGNRMMETYYMISKIEEW